MKANFKKNMRGITVLNLLAIAIIIVFVITISMNLVPPYMHNFAVRDAMKELATTSDITEMPKAKVKDLFTRKLQVNYITNVSPEALVFVKKGNETYLTMKYEVRVPLIANIDAVVKFDEEVKVEKSAES